MKLHRKRKYNREYMAKRRKELREKGICDACGFTKALAPFRKCTVCRKRQRAYLRKSRGNDRWRAGKPGRPPFEVLPKLKGEPGNSAACD